MISFEMWTLAIENIFISQPFRLYVMMTSRDFCYGRIVLDSRKVFIFFLFKENILVACINLPLLYHIRTMPWYLQPNYSPSRSCGFSHCTFHVSRVCMIVTFVLRLHSKFPCLTLWSIIVAISDS